ncbi:MAG: oxygenase MpaB family protein [Galactobacter sp.]
MDPRRARGFREVAPESVLLGGAGAAILLQIADPRVGRGVAVHSDFVRDPLKRLWGTLDYIYAVSLGSDAQRSRLVEHVNHAHSYVHGPATETTPAYDADDDDARLWVAMTLCHCGTAAWEAVLGELPTEAQDEVVRGYGALATSLGVPSDLWFRDRASFDAAFAARLEKLSVSDDARRVAHGLLAADHAPLWLRAAMPLVRWATAGLLPPAVRAAFSVPQLRYTRATDLFFRTAIGCLGKVYPVLPDRVRQAVARARLRSLAP